MKKIINGKVYDTATAQCVGEWSNPYTRRDFNWVEETLYRKRTGEFFIFGEGGPRSQYAKEVGMRQWSNGERIMPLTWDEAREWAEEKLSADEYEQAFGEVTEDDSRETMSLSLPRSMAETIRRRASQSGTYPSAYIEALISKELGS